MDLGWPALQPRVRDSWSVAPHSSPTTVRKNAAAVWTTETRRSSDSWLRPRSSRQIYGSSTTSSEESKTKKCQAEMEVRCIQPHFKCWMETWTSTSTKISDHLQAIANTAGFHFGTIEQGGTSLYPSLAQRVTSVEVLRILLSIGGTEIAHFQTWHDKAGNAPPLTDVDPVTGSQVEFPDLNAAPFGGEDFQTNLIMPEPTEFLSRHFPVCSVIRPTRTHGAATSAANGLIASGLFNGQSRAFFDFLRDLAEDADEAKR